MMKNCMVCAFKYVLDFDEYSCLRVVIKIKGSKIP